MSAFRIHRQIWLPQSREEVFGFFADPRNLEELTPGWLQFKVLDPDAIRMEAGASIDYRLRLRGIPLRWRSQIAQWDPPRGFVDIQVRGPYREWRHEHRFEVQYGGTLVVDCVDYAVPGGRLINWLLVRRDLNRVFDYRTETLCRLFGGDCTQSGAANPS